MKTLVTRFVTDESGAVLIEHGLAMVVVILVLGIGLIVGQLNIMFKMAFTAERRRRRAPSDKILARSCAAIDLLVRSGYKEAQAVHAVTARVLVVDTLSMGKGPDVEGWRRFKQWRANLLGGVASEVACAEYHLFARQLKGLPVGEVLEKGLWDRRRAPLL